MAVREYCWKSVIPITIWMSEISEILHCEQGKINHEDSYVVSV